MTLRTWDSLPVKVILEWKVQRSDWLRRHGIDPTVEDWEEQLRTQDPHRFREFQLILSDRWNDHLDQSHVACVLRRPELAKIVSDSLFHFDQQRYDLTDFVVMPNHVHVLVVFPDPDSQLKQIESWKHYTAVKINKLLGQKCRFWQQDSFDHLVWSSQQFEYLRQYIAENPKKAKLEVGEYVVYSSRSA